MWIAFAFILGALLGFVAIVAIVIVIQARISYVP
jgi:hypothetical protein